MQYLILLVAVLLSAPALAACPAVQYPADNVCFDGDQTLEERFETVVNVMAYGATADAAAASGTAPNCTRAVLSTCTTAGTGTDNTTAFDAAEAALPNGGEIFLPCGNYRVGGTGTNFYGWILNTSNIHVRGSGECTVLMAGRPIVGAVSGQAVISVCKHATCAADDQEVTAADHTAEELTLADHGYSAGDGPFWLESTTDDLPLGLSEQTDYWIHSTPAPATDTFILTATPGGGEAAFTDNGTTPFWISDADQPSGIKISDMKIVSDDPEARGHTYIIVDEGTLAGGTPAVGDDVSWNGATEDGTVVAYDATNGIIRIMPDDRAADIIADDDDVTDGTWTATDVQVSDFDGNGTSGIATNEEDHGLYVRGVNGITIENVVFEGVGDEAVDVLTAISNKSGGGVVPARNVRILNNTFKDVPGIASGGGPINLDGVHGCLVEGNHITGGWGGPVSTARGITLSSNGDITGKKCTVTDNIIDTTINTGIEVNGSTGDWEDVTISDNIILADNANADALLFSGTINTVKATGNIIEGSVDVSATITDLDYSGNSQTLSDADPDFAVYAGGTNVKVNDNSMIGGIGGCIRVSAGTDMEIRGNDCFTNTDGTDEDVIKVWTGTCAVSRMSIEDNHIVPTGSATHGISGPASFSCPTLSVNDNDIYIATPDTTTAGIKNPTSAEGNDIWIAGNATAGIHISAADTTVSLVNNRIRMDYAGDDGILVNNTPAGGVISINVLKGINGGGSAIEEAGTTDYLTVTGNMSTPLYGGGPTTPNTFVEANIAIAPTNTVTIAAGHGFTDDSGPYQLTTDGALPGGLNLATGYWINRSNATVLQFLDGPGGSVIPITDDGAPGDTHTITATSAAFKVLTGAAGGCDGNGTGANSACDNNMVR